MHVFSRPAVALAAFLANPALAAGDQALTIRTFAPEKAVLVAGIDDLNATKARFERTPFAGWWHSERVQDATKEWREDLEKSIEETAQSWGVERENVTWPTSLGLAVLPEMDEETGLPRPAFIGFVDWGADGEKFAKVYDAATAELEKRHAVTFSIQELKGRRVYVVEMAESDGHATADDESDDDFDMGSPSPFDLEKLFFTRDKGRLVLASSAGPMEDALAFLDGDSRKGAGDGDDFKGAMELVGERPDLYATLLTEPLAPLMPIFAGPEWALVQPYLGKLFGDVRGYSVGLTLDGKSAPLQQSVGVYSPSGKVGLFSLFDAGRLEKAPNVVPSDALSYGRVNVRFAGLMKIVEDTLNSLPEEQSQFIKPMFDQFAPIIAPALAAMGPGIHFYSTVRLPITFDSQHTTTAIALSDTKPVQSLVGTFAPNLALSPRDFLGNTIFSGDQSDAAIGFGGSFVFAGAVDDVEQAVRATGQGDAQSIDSDPLYQSAMKALASENLIGYGYSDTVRSLEVEQKMLAQLEELFQEEIATNDGSIDVEMFGFQTNKSVPEIMDLLKPEFVKDYVGPNVWQARSVPGGFRADFYLLGPSSSTRSD